MDQKEREVMQKELVLMLMLASCADDFTRAPVDGGPDGGMFEDAEGAESAADAGPSDDTGVPSLDAGADVVDSVAPVDGAGVDAGPDAMKCPQNGQGCSTIGQRICDDATHYWYCSGTWSRIACVNMNPVCDGGYCFGPKCVP
jgi:hypothetical protein